MIFAWTKIVTMQNFHSSNTDTASSGKITGMLLDGFKNPAQVSSPIRISSAFFFVINEKSVAA